MHTIGFIYPPAKDDDDEEEFFYNILKEACKQIEKEEKKIKCKDSNTYSVSRTCILCKYYSTLNGFCKKHTIPKEPKESCSDWFEWK